MMCQRKKLNRQEAWNWAAQRRLSENADGGRWETEPDPKELPCMLRGLGSDGDRGGLEAEDEGIRCEDFLIPKQRVISNMVSI